MSRESFTKSVEEAIRVIEAASSERITSLELKGRFTYFF